MLDMRHELEVFFRKVFPHNEFTDSAFRDFTEIECGLSFFAFPDKLDH